MYAIHRQAAPPSGVAYSLSARLTPSCLQSTSSSKSKIVRNLVTARDDFLQLFEVVEEAIGSDASAPALRPHARANGVVYDQTDGEDDIAEELEEKKPAAGNGDMQVSPCWDQQSVTCVACCNDTVSNAIAWFLLTMR